MSLANLSGEFAAVLRASEVLSVALTRRLNLAPFSRWTLRDKAAQRRLALR